MSISIAENKFILGLAENELPKIDSGIVDLTITSPPYNLGDNHHTGNKRFKPYEDSMPENEYQEWQIKVLNEIYRATNKNGSLFYNHKNRIKDGTTISPYQWLFKTNWILKQEIVWFNRSQNFDKQRFFPMTERIYWLVKSVNTKLNNKYNLTDLVDYQAEGTDKAHKRAFPLKMVEQIIGMFPEAKVIMDCFAGSGQVAIGSLNTEKKYICIEKDKTYYEQSVKRVTEHQKQERLFVPQKEIIKDIELFE